MDVDLEHTVPPPTVEYLAAARLSVSSLRNPKISRISQIYDPKIDIEGKYPNGEHKDPHSPPGDLAPNFQRGQYVKDPNAPEDKHYFVLITITLFGLVHILPFIFFFTANEYWMYKFRNTTSNSTDAKDRTYLQRYFSSMMTLTVTTPGVVCSFIATFAAHKVRATTRVFFVLIVHSTILIVQAVFVNVDTDTWQYGFFGLTLLSQLIMSCAMSLGGSGSMGLISKLPPHYLKAQLMGEGSGSVISALLRLVSIVISPTRTGAALIYFGIGSFMMVSTTILFYCATRTPFFRYYTRSLKEDVKQKIRNFRDIKEIVFILWPLMLLMFIGMMMPASAITSLVVSEDGSHTTWGDKYFVTVCTFLVPAVAGLIGRGIFNRYDVDFPIPVLYVIIIVPHVLFGSLILLSNAKPRYHLPVIVKHDWQYALVTGGQAFINGYAMTVTMIKTMRMVPPNRMELALILIGACVGTFMAISSPIGVLTVSLI